MVFSKEFCGNVKARRVDRQTRTGFVMTSSDDIKIRLKEALAECARLREENERLRALLGIKAEEPASRLRSPSPLVTNDSPPDAKIAPLFRSLFRGRDDVYPVRWEGKSGRSGYSPACSNEWDRARFAAAHILFPKRDKEYDYLGRIMKRSGF